jgi:uncharacterized protein
MEYRDFGKTGIKVSILGFGAMRLPMDETDGKHIVKEEESVKMILRAFELGVNCIDTAYPYCYNQSEAVVGKALKIWKNKKIKGSKGNKIYLSTKLPVWKITKTSEYFKYLEEQLKVLDVDCIDFYHFHSLNEENFNEKVLKFKLIKEALKAKGKGLIKYISFSFHDTPEVLKKIIDTGFFDTLLCQYNILDRSNEETISYARQKGVGVAIMGPQGGGRLHAMDFLKKDLEAADSSIAEMALKFVFSNENISIAFSGMENIEMVEENIRIANKKSFKFNDTEIRIIKKILKQKTTGKLIPCTNCSYCMPCSNNVAIPKIFKIMNYCIITGLKGNASWQYKNIAIDSQNNLADACSECGECEEKCPQKIKIVDKLKEAHKVLTES